MSTREQTRSRLLASGKARTASTPGVRFRTSELGQRLASKVPLSGTEGVDVTDGPEHLAAFLRSFRQRALNASELALEPDAPRIIQTVPVPAALLSLCTIVPTDTVNIPTVPESLQIEDAGYAADATNLPGLLADYDVASFSVDMLEAVRVGRVIPVPLAVLTDEGQAEAVINRLLSMNWAWAVENYVIQGGVANLMGITNTAGVTTMPAGSAPIDALATAAASVTADGWYGPHAVIGNPFTLYELFTLKDSTGNYLRRHEALPTVGAWVPAPGMTPGSVIVCDPSEVDVYLQGSFSVAVNQGYLDFMARGMALVSGMQRAAIWVKNPGAFVVVDEL